MLQTENYINAKANIIECNNKYIFPEQDLNLNHSRKFNPKGIGLAINWGSSRAYTSMVGFFLALLGIKIKDKNALLESQYISSVSGGSWFTGTYLFAKETNNLSDSDLLGKPIPVKEINNITLNEYNFNKEIFMWNRILNNTNYLNYIISFKTDKPENIWIDNAAKIFLEPFNCNKKVISLNKYYGKKIKENNPNISEILVPPPEYPFWICNTTLLYTPSIINGCNFVPFTPYYSGFPQIIGEGDDKVGGNLIETFSYGCEIPSNNELNKTDTLKNVNISKDQGYLTLDNLIGTSSAAYAYITYLLSQTKFTKDISLLNPTYNLWCSESPNNTKISQFGDGVLSDNTGIISLLGRNVKNIISLITPGSVFPETEEELLNNKDINTSLSPLFGFGKFSPEFPPNVNAVQVFESSSYKDILDQILYCKKYNNNIIYAKKKLKVMPNKLNGIEGNYEVNLLIIITQLSPYFNNNLPSNISSQFTNPESYYYQFPNYPDIELLYKVIDYPKGKTNLLLSYTYWLINNTELKDIIKSMYIENTL